MSVPAKAPDFPLAYPTMRRRVVLLAATAVGGGLFGHVVSSIPSPDDVLVFWVGNFCSPWLVLSFLAGRSHRSCAWAAIAGALADVACVVGFYANFLSLDPTRLDLPRSTPAITVAVASLSHWLGFVAPWVLFAVGAGVLYGLLGCWWERKRSLIAGVAVGLPFLAEPWLWRVYQGFYQGPLVVWLAEAAVGLAILVWVVAAWRKRTADQIATG